MNHERTSIPKAAADEVPPGLNLHQLKKHFGITRNQARLWAFHTGYEVSPPKVGRPVMMPCLALSEMPEGLCHYEVADKLGVPVALAKRWAASVGYKLIDGRSKYNHPPGRNMAEFYRTTLEAGASKALEEVGKELGITRERVRQLYEKLKIPREKMPHTSWKDKELVNKIRELVPISKFTRDIAAVAGVSLSTVGSIMIRHGIPFKNWFVKRREEEAATGIRICNKCHEPKPLTEYFRSHSLSGGRYLRCKVCHYHHIKDWKLRTGRQFTTRKDRKPAYAFDPVTGLPWPEGHKPCSVCKQVKLFDEFHLNRSHPTGRTSYCKSCKRIADTGRRHKRHEPVMDGDKLCVDCDKTKPIGEFYINTACKDGRSTYCKSCLSIRSRKMYERKKAMRPLEEKTAELKAVRTSQPQVTKKQAVQQLKRHEQARNRVVINSPPAFGLTAEQINKLKENKL